MQPVNDDMDNLFRQAAESYPLNTSGADFNKVRQQADMEPAISNKKEPKRNYLWLLLLLLLPLAFLLKHYNAGLTPQYSQTKNKVITPQDKNKAAGIDEADVATEAVKPQNKNDIKEQPATNQIKYPQIREKKTQAARTTPVDLTKYDSDKQPINANKRLGSHNKATRQSATTPGTEEQPYFADKAAIFPASGNKAKSKITMSADEYNKLTLAKLMDNANKTTTKQPDTGSKILGQITLQTQAANKKEDTALIAKKVGPPDTTRRKIVKIETIAKPKPGVYFGVVAGPDVSAVKTTQVNGPGYNLGLIAGYKTSKHLAFETGIIWNNKRYHAEGKDVSVEKLELQQHTDLLYLNGTCEMIEIPLSISYHFTAKAQNNLYVGAGVSSYIMKEEVYNYKSKRYNTEYYQKKEYNNTVANWLSVLQLQAGYEINFKNGSSLRLAPYAKLPLKGIGIGKLPLTSAGINFGFTIPVH